MQHSHTFPCGRLLFFPMCGNTGGSPGPGGKLHRAQFMESATLARAVAHSGRAGQVLCAPRRAHGAARSRAGAKHTDSRSLDHNRHLRLTRTMLEPAVELRPSRRLRLHSARA